MSATAPHPKLDLSSLAPAAGGGAATSSSSATFANNAADSRQQQPTRTPRYFKSDKERTNAKKTQPLLAAAVLFPLIGLHVFFAITNAGDEGALFPIIVSGALTALCSAALAATAAFLPGELLLVTMSVIGFAFEYFQFGTSMNASASATLRSLSTTASSAAATGGGGGEPGATAVAAAATMARLNRSDTFAAWCVSSCIMGAVAGVACKFTDVLQGRWKRTSSTFYRERLTLMTPLASGVYTATVWAYGTRAFVGIWASLFFVLSICGYGLLALKLIKSQRLRDDEGMLEMASRLFGASFGKVALVAGVVNVVFFSIVLPSFMNLSSSARLCRAWLSAMRSTACSCARRLSMSSPSIWRPRMSW